MRLTLFIFAFILAFSIDSFAKSDCDYGVKLTISGDNLNSGNLTWKIKAAKIKGESTNITGTAQIEDFNKRLIKSFQIWSSEPISKQKTSGDYTSNLEPGSYKITANIEVACDDKNQEDNVDVKQIEIKNSAIKDVKTVYKSSNEKAKELILVFLLMLSIILNIVLIWKR